MVYFKLFENSQAGIFTPIVLTAGGSAQRQNRPMSKQEAIMKAELERKQLLAKKEAADKASESKKNARKDYPWLQENIVVKVRFSFCLFMLRIGHEDSMLGNFS